MNIDEIRKSLEKISVVEFSYKPVKNWEGKILEMKYESTNNKFLMGSKKALNELIGNVSARDDELKLTIISMFLPEILEKLGSICDKVQLKEGSLNHKAVAEEQMVVSQLINEVCDLMANRDVERIIKRKMEALQVKKEQTEKVLECIKGTDVPLQSTKVGETHAFGIMLPGFLEAKRDVIKELKKYNDGQENKNAGETSDLLCSFYKPRNKLQRIDAQMASLKNILDECHRRDPPALEEGNTITPP